MDSSKMDEYQSLLDDRRDARGRLGWLMSRDHRGEKLSETQEAEARECRETIRRVADELKEQGVFDSWEFLTTDAIQLGLRVI